MSDATSQDVLIDHRVVSRLAGLQVLPRGLVDGNFAGMHRSPHRGASVEFAEYRKYVPGDDTRHIDWQVFARTDRYYLKEFEADTNMRLFVVVDASNSMAFARDHGSKFEYARRLAAVLSYLTIHQGDHVGLEVIGADVLRAIPSRGGPVHLHNMLACLGEFEPGGATDLAGVLHRLAEKFSRRAMVVVFSDFFCELAPLFDAFHHMHFRRHDLALFHLMDPAELDFGFDRPTRFNDLESNASVLAEPEDIRSRYLDALYTYLDRLKHGSEEHGADYRLIRTDTSYEDVLSEFLLSRLN